MGATPDAAPRPGRRSGTIGVGVVVLATALVALAGAALWAVRGYLVDEEVRIPNVMGLAFEDAAERLRAAGMVPSAFAEIDPRAGANEVLSQAPGPGQAVRPGRLVSLGVNAAAEVRVVPNLVGLREADATLRADAVGGVIQGVSYVHAEAPAGVIVSQVPPAETTLAPAQTMAIVVSRGAAARPVVLPDLRGRRVEDAEAELARLGIRRVDLVPAAISFERPFTVTDQRPGPGTEVLPATPVSLVYALEGSRVVAVPDLSGLPMWRALVTLRAARLEVGQVRRIEDPSLPPGVVEAWPAGITVVGSPVMLTVNGPPVPGDPDAPFQVDAGGLLVPDGSTGSGSTVSGEVVPDLGETADSLPEPGTSRLEVDGSRVIPFRFDPATVGVASLLREPYQLRLVVADDEGERTVFDRRLAAGEPLAVPVRVVGEEPLLQTYLNGSFFQAWRP